MSDYASDKFNVGTDKPSIAGRLMSWTAYKEDVKTWLLACSVKEELRAGLIIMRGFSKNERMMANTSLFDEKMIKHANGMDYLMREMDKVNRTSSIPTELRRLQKFMTIKRGESEKLCDYIARFRKQLREVNSDSVSNGALKAYKTSVLKPLREAGETNTSLSTVVDTEKLACLILINGANLTASQYIASTSLINLSAPNIMVDEIDKALGRVVYDHLGQDKTKNENFHAKNFKRFNKNQKGKGGKKGGRKNFFEADDYDSNGEYVSDAEDEGDGYPGEGDDMDDDDEDEIEYDDWGNVVTDQNIYFCDENQSYFSYGDDNEENICEVLYNEDEGCWINLWTRLAMNQCRICRRFGHWARECRNKSSGWNSYGSGFGNRHKGKGKGKGKNKNKPQSTQNPKKINLACFSAQKK